MTPGYAALWWFLTYAVIWLLFEGAAVLAGTSEPKFFALIAWGACYFSAAVYLGQDATHGFLETVRDDILPYASAKYQVKVAAQIKLRFGRRQLVWFPLFAATASIAATWWAISRDTDHPIALSGVADFQLVWLLLSYFFYFYVATVAVVAARFYAAFADKLEVERATFYVQGAADTPLVKGLSKLGTQVLIFWALIFVLILSSMLLAFVPPQAYRLTSESRFLFLLVPIAGFFSLGFGCLVYLKAQARIRATLQRFAHEQAAKLQTSINDLIDRGADRTPEDAEALTRLTEWQDRILAGGRYGSRAGAGLSIALPLLLPLLTLVLRFFGP